MKLNFLIIICITFFITGCSIKRSIPIEYQNEQNSSIEVKNLDSIGITKWKDDRNIALRKDNYSEKAVMRAGDSVIGITYKDKEFIRIADMVREEFTNQLLSYGVNVKKLNIIPATNNKKTLQNIAHNNNVKMVLSGDLLSFDVNCGGNWTLKCTRKVSIMINLIDKDGKELIIRELFDASFINNEGGAVLHSTLLNQLTNKVMKKAIKKAAKRVIEKINLKKS